MHGRFVLTLLLGVALAGCASAAPSAVPVSASTPPPPAEPVGSPIVVTPGVPSAPPVVVAPDESLSPSASAAPDASAAIASPSAEAMITVLSDPTDLNDVRSFYAAALDTIRLAYLDGDTTRLATYFYDSDLQSMLSNQTGYVASAIEQKQSVVYTFRTASDLALNPYAIPTSVNATYKGKYQYVITVVFSVTVKDAAGGIIDATVEPYPLAHAFVLGQAEPNVWKIALAKLR